MRLKVCTGILLLAVIHASLAFPKGRSQEVDDEGEIVFTNPGAHKLRREPRSPVETVSDVPKTVPKVPAKRLTSGAPTPKKTRSILKKEHTEKQDVEQHQVDAEHHEQIHETPEKVTCPEQHACEGTTKDAHTTKVIEEDERLPTEEEHVSEAIPAASTHQIETVKHETADVAQPQVPEKEESSPVVEPKVEVLKKKKVRQVSVASQTNGEDINALVKGSKAYKQAYNWCHPHFSFRVDHCPCWERKKLAKKYICYPQYPHCDQPCVCLEPCYPCGHPGYCNWQGFPQVPHINGGVAPGRFPNVPSTNHGNTEPNPAEVESEEDDLEGPESEASGDEDEVEDEEEEVETSEPEALTTAASGQKGKKQSNCCCINRKSKDGCQCIKIEGGKTTKKGKNVYVFIIN